jgi:hypothetical protein
LLIVDIDGPSRQNIEDAQYPLVALKSSDHAAQKLRPKPEPR